MPLVDPEVLRKRLSALTDQGVPLGQIARLVPVARTDLSSFKNGDVWGATRLGRLEAALEKAEKDLGSGKAADAPTPPPPEAAPRGDAAPAATPAPAPVVSPLPDAAALAARVDAWLEGGEGRTITQLAALSGVRHQTISRLRLSGSIPDEARAQLWACFQKEGPR